MGPLHANGPQGRSRPGLLAVGPARWAQVAQGWLEPSHVLTLRSPGPSAGPPEAGADGGGTPRPAQLELVFNDIAEARSGLVAPGAEAVERLLAFAASWDGRAPLLLSCYAGVSRSPAAAYAIACLKRGAGEERTLAQALRAASPSSTPNPLVVALADAALGRGGAMIAAVREIGRGADCFEGEAVIWDVRSGEVQRIAAAPSSTDVSQSCSTAPSTSPV